MSQFYVGMDLHTSNLQICIMDQDGKAILEKKTSCCLMQILELLHRMVRTSRSRLKARITGTGWWTV